VNNILSSEIKKNIEEIRKNLDDVLDSILPNRPLKTIRERVRSFQPKIVKTVDGEVIAIDEDEEEKAKQKGVVVFGENIAPIRRSIAKVFDAIAERLREGSTGVKPEEEEAEAKPAKKSVFRVDV